MLLSLRGPPLQKGSELYVVVNIDHQHDISSVPDVLRHGNISPPPGLSPRESLSQGRRQFVLGTTIYLGS